MGLQEFCPLRSVRRGSAERRKSHRPDPWVHGEEGRVGEKEGIGDAQVVTPCCVTCAGVVVHITRPSTESEP